MYFSFVFAAAQQICLVAIKFWLRPLDMVRSIVG